MIYYDDDLLIILKCLRNFLVAMTTGVLLYSGWSSEANNKPQYYEKTCYSEKGVNFNFALIAYLIFTEDIQ